MYTFFFHGHLFVKCYNLKLIFVAGAQDAEVLGDTSLSASAYILAVFLSVGFRCITRTWGHHSQGPKEFWVYVLLDKVSIPNYAIQMVTLTPLSLLSLVSNCLVLGVSSLW